LTALEPGQLWVFRWHGVINAAILIAVSIVAAIAIYAGAEWPLWIALIPVVVAVPLAFWLIFIAPRRKFNAWGYRLDAQELHTRSGVFIMSETVVPFRRVQHIDVARGPIERAYGVAQLVVHTAGVAHAEVTLPGLTPENAAQFRDLIREHIRQEPV
jgi:uncharacterized protein